MLVLVLLVAVGGGAALACVAGARRTASSVDRIAAATEYPDITAGHGEEPARAAELRGVDSFSTQVGFLAVVEGFDPTLIKYFIGSWDELRHQRPLIQAGRYPDPERADEVVIVGRGAELGQIMPGDEITVMFFAQDFSVVSERFVVTGTAADATETAADAAQDRSAIYFTPAHEDARR